MLKLQLNLMNESVWKNSCVKWIPRAQLPKRTFKIDVLKCDKCGGRMKLIGVVFDQPTITTTLRALGLPVRAPSTSEKTQNTHAWFGYPNRPKQN
jgi:hypothetical protein